MFEIISSLDFNMFSPFADVLSISDILYGM